MNYDLLVIGGGINGAGIARDAAGRGLSVLLVERGDLAAATSSASSKLIHGGLRYLEQFEFRLVAEALAEREILLRIAGHLAWPARFVMPHLPGLRPRWAIRLGLFLYDHLARRSLLPGSHAVRLVGTECLLARREGALWHAALSGGVEVRARAIVNAAGPWVKDVLNQRLGQPSRDAVRLVKGSHIVLPRLYDGEHAFILQNDDRRVVFMIPWEGRFTLVGTTDIPVATPDQAEATQDEVDYLCRAVSRYLEKPVGPRAVLWRYAGVRPLYDDGSSDPSAVTRDYTLRLDAAADEAPVLSVFGGKITTYRRLAEHALEKLAPYFPRLPGAWTGRTPLPGSDFKDREEARKELLARHRDLPPEVLQGVFRRHGARAIQVLGDGQLGEHFGAGLTERELRYFIEREWARGAQDVLWRRTKAGLHLDQRARDRVEAAFSR